MSEQTISVTQGSDGRFAGKDTAGKDFFLVKESDLLAVKGTKEGLEQELKTLKETKVQSDTSATEAQKTATAALENKYLASEAKLKQLEEQLKSGTASTEELKVTKVKYDAEILRAKGLESKLLEQRRMIIATSYQIPVDTLAGKTDEQLTAFEDALKTIKSRLPPGGGFANIPGGAGAVAESRFDRAKRIIATQEEKQGRTVKVSGAGLSAK